MKIPSSILILFNPTPHSQPLLTIWCVCSQTFSMYIKSLSVLTSLAPWFLWHFLSTFCFFSPLPLKDLLEALVFWHFKYYYFLRSPFLALIFSHFYSDHLFLPYTHS